MSEHKYKMTLSLSVLEHLGVNLYSSVPAVISETVANAWDADALEVKIEVIGKEDDRAIVITDNGCGMDVNDINRKFLTVGYHRRDEPGSEKTPRGRVPMGRKGIGKLSLFSIADEIKVYSKKKDERQNALRLDGAKIRQQIKGNKPEDYHPESIADSDDSFPHNSGTRLVISKLKRRITRSTDKLLRKRLARRFGVGCMNDMVIFLHDDESSGKITVADRDYFGKLEYLFQYGDFDCPGFCQLSKGAVEPRANGLGSGGKYSVHGWIGLTASSKALSGDGDNINKISIMVREKLAQEDILGSFGFSSMFTRYIIGEIYADFLDQDSEDDIATSSRQSIIEDDPRYCDLREFIHGELKHVRDARDRLKGKEGEKRARALLLQPEFNKWLEDDLDEKERKKAQKFFGRINRAASGEDDKWLFACGAQTFERFRLKGALDDLNKISIDNLTEFLKITEKLDGLEASDYYAIVQMHLKIITRLRQNIEENVKEKDLQEFIFDHLWLLDPQWRRVPGDEVVMEQDVTKAFDGAYKKMRKDEKEAINRGRVDIKYRKTSGIHVIVELKRASVSVKSTDLQAQTLPYRDALEECLSNAGRSAESVQVVCVVGKKPTDWNVEKNEERGRSSLEKQGIQVITYSALIANAYNAHREYLEKQEKYHCLRRVIDDALGDDSDG